MSLDCPLLIDLSDLKDVYYECYSIFHDIIYNYGFHDNVISKIIKSRKGNNPFEIGYCIIMKDIIVLLY